MRSTLTQNGSSFLAEKKPTETDRPTVACVAAQGEGGRGGGKGEGKELPSLPPCAATQARPTETDRQTDRDRETQRMYKYMSISLLASQSVSL